MKKKPHKGTPSKALIKSEHFKKAAPLMSDSSNMFSGGGLAH